MPRVLLPKETQRRLTYTVKDELGYSWKQLAMFLNVSSRSLENWYRGERLLPEAVFLKLVKISNFQIHNPQVLPDNWGRVKGGKVSFSQHGSFWTIEGSRKGGTNSARKFPLPDYSEDLAEFIGIMLGDGGISQNQITVTLGYSTDNEYVPYIRRLVKDLFGANISLYYPKNKDVVRLRSSGINLVKNLLTLGLVKGDKIKQQVDIPTWIFKKKPYIRACVRGLIDTDGCVHRKTRRGKNGLEYRSIGITFCSASKPLQQSFIRALGTLGLKAVISGRTIYLCGHEQIERYVKEIGFSNPKHLNRLQRFLQNYGWKKVAPENCLTLQT